MYMNIYFVYLLFKDIHKYTHRDICRYMHTPHIVHTLAHTQCCTHAYTYILYYKMQCFFVCVVSMESHTVQLTHMTFILSEPGWAWAGFSHSPIIRFDG